ncbi:MAG: helix-turn-helix transcriptional regulator [Burkholderiales bacterium]|nr:helix-turn-helix transcriptional regulator [Burkholderiales bacterium]MBI3728032.1 helix-turn-helix transcriptional regulator [Burkholderiales bacterium]
MSLLRINHLQHAGEQDAAPHAHPQGQMFIVHAGLVSVEAGQGRWVMPPDCAGWVPPHVLHGATVHGAMRGMSLYFDEDFSHARMPASLKVVRLTPLLAALLAEIADIAGSVPGNHMDSYLQVLADLCNRLPAQMLFLPMPVDSRLLGLCTHALREPDVALHLDAWAQEAGMSRRTLTRRFQQQTGWSIGHWHQQMRLLLALEKLSAGDAVTTVALDMGYQSVSAFIAMFRQYMGTTPKAWLENR